MRELAARIETGLYVGRAWRTPSTLCYADLTVNLETRDVERAGKKIELSAREFDLLTALTRHPHRVFSRDQLLDIVWGADRFVSPGAVETYISYLRAKIDAEFEHKLIHTHRGAGYSLREG